jgi:predicted metal-dependent hydrolase
MPAAAGATVMQGGRAKAYRPIPAAARRRALEKGIAAYARGDFFEAHEILEPAWMGTADIAERELYQGLIKLAAAFVHGVRGNPRGIARNLSGARERLAAAAEASPTAGRLDLLDLLAAVDERLARLAAEPRDASIDPPVLRRIPG